MNGCKYIRERIDEAEKPDVLPFEAVEHIGQCIDCGAFAMERAALRRLVAGDARVNAPINFDAVLNARLAEVKSRRSFWRLGSPAFLRLGAATAGVIVMISVAQFTGLFSDNGKRSSAPQARTAEPAPAPRQDPILPMLKNEVAPAPVIVVAKDRPYLNSSNVAKLRRGDALAGGSAPAGYLTAEDGGVVLVRGRNGDMDVQMPTVSVGAQPLLYVSAGQRTMRNVGASF